MDKNLQASVAKLASVATKSDDITTKVGAYLMICYVGDVVSENMRKTAADQEDAMDAQILSGNLQSNPTTGVVAQYMLKQPPSNLPSLVELFAQKLEQDLRTSVQSGPTVSEPLKAVNEKLKLMVENTGMKLQLIQMNQQLDAMAAGGQAPPPQGQPQQQGMPQEQMQQEQQQEMPPEGQDQMMSPEGQPAQPPEGQQPPGMEGMPPEFQGQQEQAPPSMGGY